MTIYITYLIKKKFKIFRQDFSRINLGNTSTQFLNELAKSLSRLGGVGRRQGAFYGLQNREKTIYVVFRGVLVHRFWG